MLRKREKNAYYFELLASLDIESACRDDVFKIYAQKFKNHALLSLFKKDLESTVPSTDQHFIDASFKIYFDYTIKNYGFKSLTAMHALSVSEIKSIIAWLKKYIKRHLKSLQKANRKRSKKVTWAHIDWIQNFIESYYDKSIIVSVVLKHMQTTNL